MWYNLCENFGFWIFRFSDDDLILFNGCEFVKMLFFLLVEVEENYRVKCLNILKVIFKSKDLKCEIIFEKFDSKGVFILWDMK